MNRMKRYHYWGFTLIELLVVIAIIAILAAILFPVFASAREQGRKTTCVSNVRQMGMAVMQYAQDFNETLPIDSHASSSGAWLKTLTPYTKSPLLYKCPSDKSRNWGTGAFQRKTSYATNYYMTALAPGEDNTGTHGFTKISSIAAPARVIYIAEAATDTSLDHFHAPYWVWPNPGSGWIDGGPAEEVQCGTPPPGEDEIRCHHHNGSPVFGFLDGHSSSMPFKQTFNWSGQSGERPKINLYDPTRED